MYCSYCGATVANGLNYCKQCGAKLKAAEEQSLNYLATISPQLLVQAIVAVFVLGLAGFIVLMGMMKHFRFDDGIIFGFTSLFFLLMLVLEALFIWLLLGRKNQAKDQDDSARLKAGFGNLRKSADDLARLQPQVTNDLGTIQGPVLPAATPSVIEHTTRALDRHVQ